MLLEASPCTATDMVSRGWKMTESKATAGENWLITRRSEQGGPPNLGGFRSPKAGLL